MAREHHSHAERLHRQHSQHDQHVLEERVKELERDVVQLLYERDAARDTAAQYEAIIASLMSPRRGTVYVDVE